MDNGLYIALSRQVTLFRDLEATANNIANINTTGYNAEKLAFDDYLVDSKLEGKLNQKIAFTSDPISYRDTSNGPLKVTGNTFDLAINGPGYFSIQTPLGTRYSKAGNFQIDANSTLVTPDGYPVLSTDGATVVIPDDATNVLVREDGAVTVGDQEVGRVGVSEFGNEQALKRLGNNFYSSDEVPLPATQSRVLQGTLEGSNVSGVSELVRIVKLERAAGSTAKYVEIQYDLQRKSSNAFTRAQQA